MSDAAASAPNPLVGPIAWRNARRLLAVRLDNLGDVLMTTPALSALAAGGAAGSGADAPGSAGRRRITLLASRAGAAIAGHVPAIDEVIVYDAPWVKGPVRSGQADRRLMATLARRRFDAAVIFTVSTQSALPAAALCRMAGIPLRLAYSRENPYALLTDWVRDQEVCGDGMRHEVERQLALVRSVGFDSGDVERPAPGLVFDCHPADVEGARHRIGLAGGDPAAAYLVVHPGCSASSRRYPAERFGQAAAQLAAASGLQIIFAGGPDELPEVAAALAAMTVAAAGLPGRARAISLAGRLTIGELGALIAGARLLVCNNSGPAHLAAASRTPVVVLYALTNPQHTPWQVRSRVLNRDVPCRHCQKSVCPEGHHRCLLGVDAAEVAAAGLEMLHETPAAGRETRWLAATA